MQEFAELTGQHRAAASGVGADAAPANASSRSDLSSDTGEDASDASDAEPEDAAEEAARHAAMLAEVRGSAGDRKRKRAVVASEAYPDSEHNLPTTGSTGMTPCRGSISSADKRLHLQQLAQVSGHPQTLLIAAGPDWRHILLKPHFTSSLVFVDPVLLHRCPRLHAELNCMQQCPHSTCCNQVTKSGVAFRNAASELKILGRSPVEEVCSAPALWHAC